MSLLIKEPQQHALSASNMMTSSITFMCIVNSSEFILPFLDCICNLHGLGPCTVSGTCQRRGTIGNPKLEDLNTFHREQPELSSASTA
eukprot:1216183-Amphidinium_carterae.1